MCARNSRCRSTAIPSLKGHARIISVRMLLVGLIPCGSVCGQQPLTITTATFADATVGATYMQLAQAAGGIPPYSWSINLGSLPSGMSLDGTTGQISGSAGFPGVSRFTLQVQDSRGALDSKALQILVLFPSPLHDVRFAVALDLPKQQVQRFNHVKYGDTIRLGEFPFYCGDPEFALVIDSPPILTFAGYLGPTGQNGTVVDLNTHLNAGILGQCLFFTHPNAGASAKVHADFSRITSSSSLPLTGQVTIELLGPILGIGFPFSASIPVPAQFPDKIPVDLSSTAGATLDFGNLVCKTCWQSSGSHKDIPLTINVGSIGGVSSDQVLIADASVGTPRLVNFPTQQQAKDNLETDLPLWDMNRVGLSVGESFFGSASSIQPGTGFLGTLLPIRVKGQASYKFWFIHGTREYEVVLDGAHVLLDADNSIHADLSSSRAVVRSARHGVPVLGHDKAVKSLQANVKFDRLRIEGAALKFRVADFNLQIKTRLFILPIRLSSGALEQTLNKGEVSFASITSDFPVQLPACQPTGYEKFKSHANSACGGPQIIGDLSLDAGVQKITFSLDVTTVKFRQQGKTLQLSMPMSAQ
jgi:hypothetical protein